MRRSHRFIDSVYTYSTNEHNVNELGRTRQKPFARLVSLSEYVRIKRWGIVVIYMYGKTLLPFV